MTKYRKKPVVIEAIKYDRENVGKVIDVIKEKSEDLYVQKVKS